MAGSTGVAERIVPLLDRMLGSDLPLRIRAWDGSESGAAGAPTLIVRSRRAVRRILWQPNELGLARAYVAGEIDIEGDVYDALDRLALIARRERLAGLRFSSTDRRELMKTAVLLGAVGPQPRPPAEEAALVGQRHSRGRDRAAISHHYDVGNDFYRLVLGPSMVYSCAYWASDDPAYTLMDAQRDKNDLICRKLGLQPGMRLLDVGCGWGSLLIHAAQTYGVTALGVTLSRHQADYGRKRVAEAGLEGRVEIRLQDYRDVEDGPFDAIASVGMAEHVGEEAYREYCGVLLGLLRPGGRLLNHQIARRPGGQGRGPSFIQAYVFPDGDLKPIGVTVSFIEESGFEVRDVESLREHYARTLRRWVANLEAGWDEAVRLTSPGRARVWRLYMAGSALAFEHGRISINQILAVKPRNDGRSNMPMTRRAWLGVG
ncbi:MAG: class I SAM-dependent methyltransferase [Carbonactinosporaceae bacterium]